MAAIQLTGRPMLPRVRPSNALRLATSVVWFRMPLATLELTRFRGDVAPGAFMLPLIDCANNLTGPFAFGPTQSGRPEQGRTPAGALSPIPARGSAPDHALPAHVTEHEPQAVDGRSPALDNCNQLLAQRSDHSLHGKTVREKQGVNMHHPSRISRYTRLTRTSSYAMPERIVRSRTAVRQYGLVASSHDSYDDSPLAV